MSSPLRVLVIGAGPRPLAPDPPGGAAIASAATLADALEKFASDTAYDAVLFHATALAVAASDVEALVARAALVVVTVDADAEHALGWLRRGAQDVLGADEIVAASGWRRIRFAVERRRHQEANRRTHSTDVATGLPHRQQLVEHLSQMLALREREPSPMAVVALRIETPISAPGDDADLLRRKVAVRLRAGVRASDVVAAVGVDSFVVLLGSVLAAADATRVAEKLVASLVAPFRVGAGELSVAVATGIAHYPQDGKQADRLLRRSLALAFAAPASTQAGAAAVHDLAGVARAAANDER